MIQHSRMTKPIERVERPKINSFVMTSKGWVRVTRNGMVPWVPK